MIFRDHVVLITGITRGIGRAIALRFMAEGAIVAGMYMQDDEAAQQLKHIAEDMGSHIRLYKGSVSDPTFVAEVMKEVTGLYGRLDVLVNNAGRTNDQMALFMDEQQWADVLDTNFLGTCYCSQEAVSYMLPQGKGAIINMVSVSGVYGREAQTNYATSKGAIMGLTKLYARLYAPHNIQVSAIAPGMIETDMAQGIPAEKMADFIKHTASGRLGTAEEIADAVIFLAGPLASYHTGQTLKMDGGFLR
ncbi:SDR family NAD(P)-dependent oxidoreductase [Paenibacillus amylolyticus]|uniref:SDR family NAD(P)-dependent oxidoreductase n=1 Tax=Paenibacillus amylolyticus TaxID=1451 RepID=UPI003EC014BA